MGVMNRLELLLSEPPAHLWSKKTHNEILTLVSNLEEERNAYQVTAEEGGEIIAELTGALASLSREPVETCSGGCAGHLGPKASAAIHRAEDAWFSLRAENERLRDALHRLITCCKRFGDYDEMYEWCHSQESTRADGLREQCPTCLAEFIEHTLAAEREEE